MEYDKLIHQYFGTALIYVRIYAMLYWLRVRFV